MSLPSEDRQEARKDPGRDGFWGRLWGVFGSDFVGFGVCCSGGFIRSHQRLCGAVLLVQEERDFSFAAVPPPSYIPIR